MPVAPGSLGGDGCVVLLEQLVEVGAVRGDLGTQVTQKGNLAVLRVPSIAFEIVYDYLDRRLSITY